MLQHIIPRLQVCVPAVQSDKLHFQTSKAAGQHHGKKHESALGCLSLLAYVSGPSWKSFELVAEPRFSGATVSTHREYSAMVLNLKV